MRVSSHNLRPILTKWGIPLGLTLIYLLAFPAFYRYFGPSTIALSAILVAVAGWYFGILGGAIASLLDIILNGLLLVIQTHISWGNLVTIDYAPGFIVLVLTGLLVGWFRKILDERTHITEESRLRERYLALLSISTHDILASTNPEDRYYNLTSHMVNLLVADYGTLILWDETHKRGIIAASTGQAVIDTILDPGISEVITSIIESNHPLAIDDVANSDLNIRPSNPTETEPSPASVIIIPLVTKDEKLGVVSLAFNQQHHFHSQEVSIAKLAGTQIALALHTARQETEIQQRFREMEALSHISRALSETERVGLDEVLQLIVNSAKDLIPGAQNAVIHLLDVEHQLLIPRAVTDLKTTENKLHMRLGEGVAGQVIASGNTINIADVENDPRFLRDANLSRFSSLMVAPVQSGEERLGTISVHSDQANAFTASDQQLLSSLGTQAAIAIENAHLLETTRQSLNEINALYRITQGLAASLETQRLMQDVVDLLKQNFGYYHAGIFIIDPENEDLVAKYGSGKLGELLKDQRLPAGAGIIGHAAATGEPFFTNDVDNVVFFASHPLLPDTKSELAIPIKVDNRVFGVLDIQHRPPARLTEHDLQLVTTVAEQLAIALQKADLYTNLQNSLQQEKAIRSQLIQSERLALVGRLLASVSHELNNPLQAIQNALFLLKEEHGISEQGQKDLQIVLSEAERMAALIDRLRTSYRPTNKDDFQSIQINDVVDDIYALVSTHLRHNQVTFEFHPDPDLPPVAGIPEQLRQIILNLVMNAAEAMPGEGQLTVTTQRTSEDEVAVTITDTGPGIDPALLPHIFDAFVTDKETGTGLGLTITYDIVSRHNGRIIAENAPEGGASFTFWLPAFGKETA